MTDWLIAFASAFALIAFILWCSHILIFLLEIKMKNYLINRAKEASTWRGIILILTAIGVPVAPAMAEAIVSVGLALAGAVGVFTADK